MSIAAVPQLGDVGGDAPRLVAREQTGSRPSARLIFEIHVGHRLSVGVADDEAGVGFLGGPERREAAAQDGIVQWNLILLFQCLKGGDHAYTRRSADVLLRAFDRHRGFTGNRM